MVLLARIPENPTLGQDEYFNITFTWVGRNVLLDAYNQGECNSCWACAGTAAIAALVAIRDGTVVESLSIQQVIDCATEKYSWDFDLQCVKSDECPLGWAEHVYEFSMSDGIVEEDRYMYTIKRGNCRAPLSDGAVVKITGYHTIDMGSTLAEIEDIIRRQPITGVIRVFESFYRFIGQGTYTGPTVEDVNISLRQTNGYVEYHIVLIVGYGQDENGELFYLIQNTWSKEWGHKGFGRVSRLHVFGLAYPVF